MLAQGKEYQSKALADTGATAYSFIDEKEAQLLSEHLDIVPIPLAKPRYLCGYDGKIRKKPVTHAIYPSMKVGDHLESTVPMLITNLGNQHIILGKPWMNKHKVLLDMADDRIIFLPGRCDHTGAPQARPKASKKPLLPLPPPEENKALNIAEISATAFYMYARNQKKRDVQCFSMTMAEMEKAIQDGSMLDQIHEVSEATEGTIKQKLPKEYHDLIDVFDRSKAKELPPHRSYDHKIELEAGKKPPQSRLYPMSGFKLQKVKEYLDDNLKKGFISPSTAPYTSPVLFVQKHDGSLRFCVDYRKLNAITIRNRYPIPLIEETLARVIGCKYLTKLDIIAAFNKLRMHPDSEDLTTFTTSFGAFKYHVLPFGLTNGPASFQHYMNDTLFEYLNDFCQVYLDDILIYSKTEKEHKQQVRKVLLKLREAGLQVDIEKCEFHVQETTFLGLIVSTEGLRMDPSKVEAIVNWEPPTRLKEVQAFVGFCNFYRRFIKDFSKTVRPLVSLNQKDCPFQWSEACQAAFERLKSTVTSAPVLRHYDRSRPAVLETDSSDYVNGGVLSQADDDGVLHPVAFYSKNLLPAECNYEIYDKELLAIVRCLEHWRPELESTDIPVQIFTDHKSLEYFMQTKELTRRQARWAEKLADFNFKIMYRSGKSNGKADALTRMPNSVPADRQDERQKHQYRALLSPECFQKYGAKPDSISQARFSAGLRNRQPIDSRELNSKLTNARFSGDRESERGGSSSDITSDEQINALTDQDLPLYARVALANKEDDDCERIRDALEKDPSRIFETINLRHCSSHDNALFYKDRLWVPAMAELRTDVIKESHDQPACGHPGRDRTLELVKRQFYWRGMKDEVARYIRNCYICQRSKAPRDQYNGLLQALPVPEQRWQDISMDFITGLPVSEGFNAICAIVDRLSKERHYAPCIATDRGTSAEATADILMRYVFRSHGLPESIISDRGPQFVSLVWKALCQRLKIDVKLSTAFHPETDGQTERANQDVERHLRTYCAYMQDDWVRLLPIAEFADNNSIASTTGVTPFFANKGFHPRMSFSPPADAGSTARERIQYAKANDIADHMTRVLDFITKQSVVSRRRITDQANRKRSDIIYDEGDMVFLSSRNISTERPSRKLDDKMLGPFRVLDKVGSSYRLELPASMQIHNVFHPSLLRKAATDPLPGQQTEPPRPVTVDGQEEWEIDDILDARLFGRNRRLQFRVRWKDEQQPDRQWYYADGDEFGNAQDIVDDFYARYPNKPGRSKPL